MLKYHIQTVELTSTQASISFNNIPQDYSDLVAVYSLRSSSGGPFNIYIAFNGSTSSFSSRNLEGDASSTYSNTTARYVGVGTGATETANTFGNGKLTILNYSGNTNKSFSADSVNESNATLAYQTLHAGLWSNTSPISSIDFTGATFAIGSSISLYGIKRGSDRQTLFYPALEGGTVTTSGGYTYHTFRSSGTLTVNRDVLVETLLVGGGGSSGVGYSGGGGAGGVVQSSMTLLAGRYNTIVGAGGADGNGSDSTLSSATAVGGGRGANGGRNNGFDGASGGGGGGVVSSPNTLGGTGIVGQGNNGGQGTVGISSYEVSGGGGGAGAVGGNATTSTSGNGGAGTGSYSAWASATSSGASGYYGGGGAGGHWYRTSGTAGIGGGGSVDNPGTANTGGGGGGRYLGGAALAGGSGIIIVRYLTP